MADKLTLQELLSRNEAVQSTHQSPGKFADMIAQGISLAKTAVVSCIDPRADPNYYFKIVPGEVVIFRDVGGQVVPLLNDIVSVDTLLNFDRLIVVHHTDCGALMIEPENVKKVVREREPQIANIEHQHWAGIKDLEDSLKKDVEFLRGSTIVRDSLKPNIKGYLYDIETGKLTLVAE